ncbi:methyltransferase domain-containing protein [Kitasatospora azatica]|uniref:methyltransferase domain-containing protein n=1 Tax=Kitasatospora azatica TaxID=58347 RepID=UPI00068D1234|nr:methyltransferase domain-containing protein [Kitasatospora azatica]
MPHPAQPPQADGYVFDRSWAREHERLAALEQVFDEATTERLTALGVGEGWHCLEAGCGGGSTARWLARRVGPTGEVLATDLDPRFAEGHGLPNLTVRRHDLLADPLPSAAFDLVHARALLEHLPGRAEALRRLVEATRPGGWVVIEDFDIEGPMVAAIARYWPAGHRALADRLYRALEAGFTAADADAGYGRRLPDALDEAGLTEVGARLHAPLLPGATPFLVLTLRQLRTPLLATGLITAQELDEAVDLIQRQDVRYVPNVMVTAWGRRPPR